MKRYIFLFVWLMTGVVVKAQQENFSKSIEIQREYELVVQGAERIESEVRLLDTTIQRPTLSYRITPTNHPTNFSVGALRPVEIATARWEVPTTLYLNVGAGLPLQSEVDLYWSPVKSERSMLGVWLNHEGQEGMTTNLDGERIGSLLLRNQAGLHYTLRVDSLTRLSTQVNYRGSMGNGYGGVGVVGDRDFVSVHDLDAKVNLSGRFGSSPLGYDANLMGLYAFNGMDESVWRFNVNFGLLGLNKLNVWLPSKVTLHYSGVQSYCQEPYFDTSVTFVPEWSFRIGEWIPVSVMAGYDYMVYRGAKNTLNGVISNLSVGYDRFAALRPYLTLANDVQTQVTRMGLWRNPYMSMLPLDSRKIYLAELGVKGDVGSVSYKLSGATRWFSSYLFEVVEVGTPTLAYGRSNGQRVWYGEGEVMWRPRRWMSFEGSVRYTSLGAAESATAEFSPRKWQTHVGARYDWGRRLSFGVRADWASSMSVACRQTGVADVTLEVPSYVDLGVEAEWHHTERTALWLRGENLLNQPIYHWATYKAPGAGFRLGVRMSF